MLGEINEFRKTLKIPIFDIGIPCTYIHLT